MNWKRGLLNFVLLSLLASVAAAAIAMDTNLLELLEVSDQIDKSEKQDFQAALDRANACIRARNFTCAESELAKAKKVANSGQDKKRLLASQGGLASEKQQLANEKIREEKARLAQLEEEEEDRRREKRERRKQAEEEFEQARAERASEERESTRQAWNNVGLEINRKAAENAAILDNLNRQTNAAVRDSNRALAAQAAERSRARAEQEEREADRRRDAARKRADTQRLAQVQERDETNARNKREADATRVQQEREQKRIEDEKRNQEARDSMERKRVAEAEAKNGAITPTQLPRDPLYSKFVPGSAEIGATVGKDANIKKVEHGPEQLEAVAVCWQSKHNEQHWQCDGPIQDTILSDDTLEKQLYYAGCPTPRANDGARTIRDRKAMVYLCGFGLSGGDYNVVKKYGITVQRNKYQCSGSVHEKSHCKENFQLTD